MCSVSVACPLFILQGMCFSACGYLYLDDQMLSLIDMDMRIFPACSSGQIIQFVLNGSCIEIILSGRRNPRRAVWCGFNLYPNLLGFCRIQCFFAYACIYSNRHYNLCFGILYWVLLQSESFGQSKNSYGIYYGIHKTLNRKHVPIQGLMFQRFKAVDGLYYF